MIPFTGFRPKTESLTLLNLFYEVNKDLSISLNHLD